jgi:hypothetical protein
MDPDANMNPTDDVVNADDVVMPEVDDSVVSEESSEDTAGADLE